jgi:hypothetical protein
VLLPTGQSGAGNFVGDYSNPILKPQTAEIIKQRGEVSLAGKAFPDPDSQCLSQPVPYIFWNFEVQILQQPGKITILYHHDHDFRQIRLNQPHAEHIVPSWHGDSVGHFEGDTLLVDTIGIKPGRFRTLDRFGTPYSQALHVVERYHFLDYDAAKEAQARAEKQWVRIPNYPVDPNYRGRGVQLEFTVEDPNVFTSPWTGLVSYLRAARPLWEEYVCAENVSGFYGGDVYYSDKDATIRRKAGLLNRTAGRMSADYLHNHPQISRAASHRCQRARDTSCIVQRGVSPRRSGATRARSAYLARCCDVSRRRSAGSVASRRHRGRRADGTFLQG